MTRKHSVSSTQDDDSVLVGGGRDEWNWRAAVHEAGHAVIGVVAGYEIRDARANGAFRCRADPLTQASNGTLVSPGEDEETKDAIYTLAGGAAERFILQQDADEAFSESDNEHFSGLGQHLNPAERERWRGQMRQKVAKEVENHRQEILAVALELESGRVLGHKAVRAVMQRARK